MNSSKAQVLYNGITGIDENIIEEAQSFSMGKNVKFRMKWFAFAACMCLAVLGVYSVTQLGLFDRMGSNSEQNRGGEGITYMSYAGPVFPLSALNGGDTLMAVRNINFDFSPYAPFTKSFEMNGEIHEYESYASQSIVTDRYVLTNPDREEQAVTLIYPFAASLADDIDLLPTVTVDGRTVQAALHVGPSSGGYKGAYHVEADVTQSLNPAELTSWEEYRALLDRDYQTRAFDALPELTQPVVVYEISDMYGERSAEATAPTLSMAFTIDYEKTSILTFGFNGCTTDRTTGYCARDLFIPPKDSVYYGDAYLIVLGDDIGDYTLEAYVNGACEKEMKNAGGTVTRYETTLGEILATAAKQYLNQYRTVNDDEDASILSRISEEVFTGLAAELMCNSGTLSHTPAMRYDTGFLEDIFSDNLYLKRVSYLSFDVILPSDSSVEVEAEMVKEASMDFIGAGRGRNGYDMVTKLGSSLNFTGQSASVSNMEDLEILSQNFGFDLENGITEVELNPTQEHYYLEVRKRSK